MKDKRIDQEIERIDPRITRLRTLIADAGAAIKDLRAAQRDAEESLRLGVQDVVRQEMERQVAEAIGKLGERIKDEMARSVAKVTREFDKLQALCLGLAQDDEDDALQDIIQKAIAVRRAQEGI